MASVGQSHAHKRPGTEPQDGLPSGFIEFKSPTRQLSILALSARVTSSLRQLMQSICIRWWPCWPGWLTLTSRLQWGGGTRRGVSRSLTSQHLMPHLYGTQGTANIAECVYTPFLKEFCVIKLGNKWQWLDKVTIKKGKSLAKIEKNIEIY